MHTHRPPSNPTLLYNSPSHPRNFHHFIRGSPGHHSHLGHTTTIIIAVVASAGGIFVVLFLWRTISRCSSRRHAAPLPPVQPLAHQRELQLAAFSDSKDESRPQTWYSEQPTPSYHHSSKASLLPHQPPRGPDGGPSREPSFRTQGTLDSAESPYPAAHLHLPNPSFNLLTPQSTSSSSLSSSGEQFSPSGSGIQSSPSASSPSMHPRTRSASRPFSMLSTATSNTGVTTRSRTSIRGAPHAPHSNVQIVLPAPLAPELYPYMIPEDPRARTFAEAAGQHRASWGGSMTDRWVNVGSMGAEPVKQVRRQGSRESPRISRDARSTTSLPQRRSSSNPPPASRLRQSSMPLFPYTNPPTQPPVPRVPSAYGPPPGMAQATVALVRPQSPQSPHPPSPL